jgi:hypothetical protein
VNAIRQLREFNAPILSREFDEASFGLSSGEFSG